MNRRLNSLLGFLLCLLPSAAAILYWFLIPYQFYLQLIHASTTWFGVGTAILLAATILLGIPISIGCAFLTLLLFGAIFD